jgi:hypothetical protein
MLFPLPLLGFNTPQVESMSSYVNRLAAAHGVSHCQLIAAAANTTKDGQLNGHSDFAKTVVDGISKHTGKGGLTQGTLLRFRGNLAGNYIESIKTDRRWCPRCVARNLNEGTEGYDPLMWSLDAVQHCPIHDTLLVDRCPRCNAFQRQLSSKPRTRCQRCDTPLGGKASSVFPTQFQRHCVRSFTEVLPVGHLPTFQPDAVSIFLHACIAVNSWRFAEAVQRFGASASRLNKLMIDRLPTMTTALHLSSSSQASLLGIFDNPEAAASQLCFDFAAPLPEKRSHKRVPTKHREWAYDSLLHELVRPTWFEGPSLRRVCMTCGVTSGFLRYAFPQLVEQVVARRDQWRKQRKLELQFRAAAAAASYISSSTDILADLSCKRAVEEMRSITKLPKHVLAAALAEHIEQIRT